LINFSATKASSQKFTVGKKKEKTGQKQHERHKIPSHTYISSYWQGISRTFKEKYSK
jgi:hypothetical protein